MNTQREGKPRVGRKFDAERSCRQREFPTEYCILHKYIVSLAPIHNADTHGVHGYLVVYRFTPTGIIINEEDVLLKYFIFKMIQTRLTKTTKSHGSIQGSA